MDTPPETDEPNEPLPPLKDTSGETVTAQDLAGPLAENMPVPTAVSPETSKTDQPVIAESIQSQLPQDSGNTSSEKPDPYNGTRDKNGQGKLWDRTKYKADSSGAPLYDKSGFFISVNKGRGGINRTQAGTGTNSIPPLPDSEPQFATPFRETQSSIDQFDAAAETFLQTGYGIGAALLTDDFRPEHDTQGKFTTEGKLEHESIKIPLAAVLREKGTTGLTPTQMLMFAIAAFVAKKASKPTVREKFVLLYLKVKGWFNKTKLPKAA